MAKKLTGVCPCGFSLTQLKRKMKNISEDFDKAGAWLSKAMENSWAAALNLMKIPTLENVLGERHRIIINDWLLVKINSANV
jgi:hypothetical protein